MQVISVSFWRSSQSDQTSDRLESTNILINQLLCYVFRLERKWLNINMIITLFFNLWISTIVALWIKYSGWTIAQSKWAFIATIKVIKHVAILIKVTSLDCTVQRVFWLIWAVTNLSVYFDKGFSFAWNVLNKCLYSLSLDILITQTTGNKNSYQI